MKKVILLFGLLMTLCAAGSYAQNAAPSCQNDNALEARIDAIEASGWVELSRNFYPVYYFETPEHPFLIGTIEIVFGVDCEPGEPCPQIARLYREDATQVNDNVCVWSPTN